MARVQRYVDQSLVLVIEADFATSHGALPILRNVTRTSRVSSSGLWGTKPAMAPLAGLVLVWQTEIYEYRSFRMA